MDGGSDIEHSCTEDVCMIVKTKIVGSLLIIRNATTQIPAYGVGE